MIRGRRCRGGSIVPVRPPSWVLNPLATFLVRRPRPHALATQAPPLDAPTQALAYACRIPPSTWPAPAHRASTPVEGDLCTTVIPAPTVIPAKAGIQGGAWLGGICFALPTSSSTRSYAKVSEGGNPGGGAQRGIPLPLLRPARQQAAHPSSHPPPHGRRASDHRAIFPLPQAAPIPYPLSNTPNGELTPRRSPSRNNQSCRRLSVAHLFRYIRFLKKSKRQSYRPHQSNSLPPAAPAPGVADSPATKTPAPTASTPTPSPPKTSGA